MKIACLDASAQQRLALKQTLEAAFDSCRAFVGHVETISLVPASVEEVMVQRTPDACILGPGLSVDRAASICHALRKHFNSERQIHGQDDRQVSIFVIVPADQHDLRTLRRFEKIADEVFRTDDPPARIVHKILSIRRSPSSARSGKTITISGVKGGVGATSIAAALAHAAQALGKSPVLVDLSAAGSLCTYCGANRSTSPEFAALLHEGRGADKSIILKSVVTAPNGLDILLPPGLSSDIRTIWLHDRNRFEVTLEAIDYLEQQFDMVLVDLAGAEGILPYALQSRASSRLLVTADDPASVHLLARSLDELRHVPGAGRVHLVINSISRGGIARRDILDFLAANDWFDSQSSLIDEIPFDQRGRDWIGTGNSFYTESSTQTRRRLEQAVRKLSSAEQFGETAVESRARVPLLERWFSRSVTERAGTPRFLKGLPEPARAQISPEPKNIAERRPPAASSWLTAVDAVRLSQLEAAAVREKTGEIYFYRHPQIIAAADELLTADALPGRIERSLGQEE